VDRVAQQADGAGQDRDQQFGDAGDGEPGRADRDGAVRFPAFLRVIARGRQGNAAAGSRSPAVLCIQP
jgi:hypothetical protein